MNTLRWTGYARRFLAERILRLRDTLEKLAYRIRDGIAATVGDAVAGIELGNTCTNRDHCARHLVPQNLRRGQKSVMNFLDVSSTNAAGAAARGTAGQSE